MLNDAHMKLVRQRGDQLASILQEDPLALPGFISASGIHERDIRRYAHAVAYAYVATQRLAAHYRELIRTADQTDADLAEIAMHFVRFERVVLDALQFGEASDTEVVDTTTELLNGLNIGFDACDRIARGCAIDAGVLTATPSESRSVQAEFAVRYCREVGFPREVFTPWRTLLDQIPVAELDHAPGAFLDSLHRSMATLVPMANVFSASVRAILERPPSTVRGPMEHLLFDTLQGYNSSRRLRTMLAAFYLLATHITSGDAGIASMSRHRFLTSLHKAARPSNEIGDDSSRS